MREIRERIINEVVLNNLVDREPVYDNLTLEARDEFNRRG